MYWLLGRRSKLSLENKLRLYKCVLKPVWTYGIQLWGCAKPSHTQIIQRLQSKILRSITNAPWYVSNSTIQNDLHIPFVPTEISSLSFLYHQRLAGHHNALITAMTIPPTIVRRLKRQWPTDLSHNTAEINLSCITYFRVFDGVSLMNGFSLHVTTSSTFTYCSSYGVDCKLTLRK